MAEGEIRIGDEIYRKTVALSTSEVFDSGWEKPVAELTTQDFSQLLLLEPELILLGTGDRCIFAPRTLTFELARTGIGLEAMTTAAAARTFNVLAGEGRNVAAVLYL